MNLNLVTVLTSINLLDDPEFISKYLNFKYLFGKIQLSNRYLNPIFLLLAR